MVISGTATTEAPRPKSPPAYPDFCGRHKLQVEVQSMNREIGFLKEEIHSLEELPPASKCCKEVNEFMGTKPDPLIPMTRRKHKSCRCWRWIRAKLCLNFSWVCCSCKCSFKFRKPTCFSNPCKKRCCNPCKKRCCNCKPKCCSCHCPSCHCCDCCCVNLFQCSRCSKCCCWDIFSCCKPSCSCPRCYCPKCSCGCVFSCPNCSDACLCLSCTRPCCVSRCLCP